MGPMVLVVGFGIEWAGNRVMATMNPPRVLAEAPPTTSHSDQLSENSFSVTSLADATANTPTESKAVQPADS